MQSRVIWRAVMKVRVWCMSWTVQARVVVCMPAPVQVVVSVSAVARLVRCIAQALVQVVVSVRELVREAMYSLARVLLVDMPAVVVWPAVVGVSGRETAELQLAV